MICSQLVEEMLSFGSRLTDALLGRYRSGEEQQDPQLAEDVAELLDQFAAADEGYSMLEAGAQALNELGKIPALLKWNKGLRQALYDLVLDVVVQAERYGANNGVLKRRFAVDLMCRVLRNYEPSPLFELVEDVTIQPYVGVLVDWTVEVLNLHDAWPVTTQVKLPGFYSGRYGALLRLQGWIWRVIAKVRDAVVYVSSYERSVRDALRKLEPQVKSLETVLPPSAAHKNLEEIATVVAKIGKLTAPHVRMMTSLLKMAAEIAGETPEQRRQAAYTVMKTLLERACRNNLLALKVIDSSVGEFMIQELVHCTDRILSQSGLFTAPTVASAVYPARRSSRQ